MSHTSQVLFQAKWFLFQNPFTDILSAALDESGITGDDIDFSVPESSPETVQYVVSHFKEFVSLLCIFNHTFNNLC
jgi:hypothetical protein